MGSKTTILIADGKMHNVYKEHYKMKKEKGDADAAR